MKRGFTIGRSVTSERKQAGLAKANHQLLQFVEANLKEKISFLFCLYQMVLFFINCVAEGKTIDHNYYIENCLKLIVKEIWKQRRSAGTKGIKLLENNSRPHFHSDVINYLTGEGINIMPHPAYSPVRRTA